MSGVKFLHADGEWRDEPSSPEQAEAAGQATPQPVEHEDLGYDHPNDGNGLVRGCSCGWTTGGADTSIETDNRAWGAHLAEENAKLLGARYDELAATLPPTDMRGWGTPEHDPVNHPSHYTSHPSGVECIQITRHMPFCEGNVVKYLWRAGLKEDAPTLQDYDKALWYLIDARDQLARQQS